MPLWRLLWDQGGSIEMDCLAVSRSGSVWYSKMKYLRLDSNRSRNNRDIFRLLCPLQSIARSELENCHESVTNKNREGAETSVSEN